jgi:predicted transcriptional regulator YdeE
MEPKIVSMPAFTVVGGFYRGRNENQEIPQLWRETGPRFEEIENMVGDYKSYGIMDNLDQATGNFDYVAGVGVSGTGELPEGMVSCSIPAATYAVVRCTLPTLTKAFHQVYDSWLPGSDYRRAPGPEFELYDSEFDAEDPNSPMYIYIPVEKGH